MPDKSGYFSKEDHEKIQTWIGSKSNDSYKCSCCSGQEFSVFSHLVNMSIATSSGPSLDVGYEAVGLVCSICGNLSWFDADKIGVGTSAPQWDPVKDGGDNDREEGVS